MGTGRTIEERLSEAETKIAELEADGLELEERLETFDDRVRDLLAQLETSLERRIGNVEDDVQRTRSDVDALERGSR